MPLWSSFLMAYSNGAKGRGFIPWEKKLLGLSSNYFLGGDTLKNGDKTGFLFFPLKLKADTRSVGKACLAGAQKRNGGGPALCSVGPGKFSGIWEGGGKKKGREYLIDWGKKKKRVKELV